MRRMRAKIIKSLMGEKPPSGYKRVPNSDGYTDGTGKYWYPDKKEKKEDTKFKRKPFQKEEKKEDTKIRKKPFEKEETKFKRAPFQKEEKKKPTFNVVQPKIQKPKAPKKDDKFKKLDVNRDRGQFMVEKEYEKVAMRLANYIIDRIIKEKVANELVKIAKIISIKSN